MSTIPERPENNGHLQYLLTAYLFENISDAGRKEVEGHLAACAECRAELAELRSTLGMVEDALAPPSLPGRSGEGAGDGSRPAQYSFEARRLERVMQAARKERTLFGWVRRHGGLVALATAAAAMFVIVPLFQSLTKSRGGVPMELGIQNATSLAPGGEDRLLSAASGQEYGSESAAPVELAQQSFGAIPLESAPVALANDGERLRDKSVADQPIASPAAGGKSGPGGKDGALGASSKNSPVGAVVLSYSAPMSADSSRPLSTVAAGRMQQESQRKRGEAEVTAGSTVTGVVMDAEGGAPDGPGGNDQVASRGAIVAANDFSEFAVPARTPAPATPPPPPAVAGLVPTPLPAESPKSAAPVELAGVNDLDFVQQGAPVRGLDSGRLSGNFTNEPLSVSAAAGGRASERSGHLEGHESLAADPLVAMGEETNKSSDLRQFKTELETPQGTTTFQWHANSTGKPEQKLKLNQPEEKPALRARGASPAQPAPAKEPEGEVTLGKRLLAGQAGTSTRLADGLEDRAKKDSLDLFESAGLKKAKKEPAEVRANVGFSANSRMGKSYDGVVEESDTKVLAQLDDQVAESEITASRPENLERKPRALEESLVERKEFRAKGLAEDSARSKSHESLRQSGARPASPETAAERDAVDSFRFTGKDATSQPRADLPAEPAIEAKQSLNGQLGDLSGEEKQFAKKAAVEYRFFEGARGFTGLDYDQISGGTGFSITPTARDQSDATKNWSFAVKPDNAAVGDSETSAPTHLFALGFGGGFAGGRGRTGGAPFGDTYQLSIVPDHGERDGGEGGSTSFGLPALQAQLEPRFRAYNYYRSLDPGLTPEVFFSQTLKVPAPAVGDEGLGEVGFKTRYGVNPFVDTSRDHFSTFGMDVDTASFTLARAMIQSGKLPDPKTVRVEEMVNYFREEVVADPRTVFTVRSEGGPAPFGEGLDLLKITVKARELLPGERKNAVLTFAVDTSGSMNLGDRLVLVRQALETLVASLKPEDRVAVIAFGASPYLVLPHTAARERERILSAVHSLAPGGGTNVEAGLDLAYRVADEVFDAKGVNRVVLCSDGVANVGSRGPDEIMKKVEVFAKRGIYLSSVGFGMGKYNDAMLETLANKGNGNYAYVDSPQAAAEIFQKSLPSTLQVLAQDAKIQVDFDPGVVSHYRLLGYENRDIADKDFRNDKVDAGEVGPSSTVTVLYELQRKPSSSGDLGKVFIRYRDTGTGRVDEFNYPIPPGVLATSVKETSDRFRFIACAAETAEILRQSYWARNGSFADVLATLDGLTPEFKARAEARELTDLVTRAQALVLPQITIQEKR